jgi:hypothetical protein
VANKRAHHLFMAKANQPTLLACCAGLPWDHVPVGDRTRVQAHGRVELRTLKAVTANHLSFPHAAQVLQVTGKTRDLGANPRRWRTVVVYAITSLPIAHASPARLADLIRGHWAVEALHHVRDTTYAEDASQLRPAGHGDLAQPRHRVLGQAGPVNLAAALRHHARDPARPLATLGITPA